MRLGEIMDEVIRQSTELWLEEQKLARYYKQMHFNNLVSRAEFMEDKGVHMEKYIVVRDDNGKPTLGVSIADMSAITSITQTRHRMSKEIAQELKEVMGDGAYLYCLERLSNNTPHPQLWHGILAWLDEGVDDGADGVAFDKHEHGDE